MRSGIVFASISGTMAAIPPPNTWIKVRAQARGGKFLGPKVTAPQLAITGNGEPLANPITLDNSGSGTVVATPDTAASRNAVFVATPPEAQSYPAAGAYFVEPPSVDTVGFYLSEAMLVTFTATAYAPDPVTASATMWMSPGMNLTADPGLVLTFPGLVTSVTKTSYSGGVVSVTASVEMMCGCPITPQPWTTTPPDTEPYWPSYELEVTATVNGQTFPLQCTGNNTFSGTLAIALENQQYGVMVVAQQAAETNVGIAMGSVSGG